VEKATITIPGGPVLTYEDSGGAGVPIIFSHGLFMDRTMFGPQVERFSAERRCIVWDERAHGETESHGEFTYWDSARDLLALMDALEIDQAVHFGMSQGGLLGMRAALLAPERFTAIVMHSSQAGGLAPDEGTDGFKAIIAEWVEQGATEDKLQFLVDLILGPGVDPTYWRTYWAQLTPEQITDAVSALYSIDDVHDRLPDVAMPVLVIHGKADVSTPWERAERVAREVPDSRGWVLIEGAPHANNLSHPEIVNEATARFLNDVAPVALVA
jgi:3-oxoadipate enol-lactonase